MKDSEIHDLVRSVRDGGQLAAYARLVEAMQPMVYSVALRVVRRHEDALDVMQEAYLRAFRRLQDLREAAAFAGWLRRIVITTAYEHMRRKRRTCFLDSPDSAAVPVLDDQETEWNDEQREALAHAILQLEPGDRAVCERLYYGKWTIARLAAEAGTTEPAMRKRLQRIRNKLRKEIEMSEQQATSGVHLPSSMPAKIVESLARPKLLALPENPIARIWENIKARLPEFEEVEVPEIIEDARLFSGFPELDMAEYIRETAPMTHRLDDSRFLRAELDMPLLLQLRDHPGAMNICATGKVYRAQTPTRARAEMFHQAELLIVREGLGEWDFMTRLLDILNAISHGQPMRFEQVPLFLCERGWEIELEWDGQWTVVASWGKYKSQVVRHLGSDITRFAAIGVSFGLERLACLHFGIDDIRKIDQARVEA